MKYTWNIPENIDPEVVELCSALNSIEGVYTVDSCCGHGEYPYRIYLFIENIDVMRHICYWLDRCHTGIAGWSLIARTDCSKSPTSFLIEGTTGEQSYEESKKIAEHIRNDEEIPQKGFSEKCHLKNKKRYKIVAEGWNGYDYFVTKKGTTLMFEGNQFEESSIRAIESAESINVYWQEITNTTFLKNDMLQELIQKGLVFGHIFEKRIDIISLEEYILSLYGEHLVSWAEIKPLHDIRNHIEFGI